MRVDDSISEGFVDYVGGVVRLGLLPTWYKNERYKNETNWKKDGLQDMSAWMHEKPDVLL